jgi:DNA-binding SARP family transcriptional activator
MAPVTFGLLGPLEIRAGERSVPLAGPKRRALLALLLVHHNRVVSVDRIIDALWGDDPPASVRAQVQSLVHAVRQQQAEWGGPTIETRPPGYVLAVDPSRVDLSLFECRAEEARRAAAEGRPEDAAEAFRAALTPWRGPALDGLDAPFVAAEAARLEEQRLLVLEQRIEADQALGRHALLVAELMSLVAEHPFRERLRAALMLALHRCGRQAEALDVYRRGREELAENLGLDPGRELRELERAILRDEPSLHLDAAAAPPRAPGAEQPSAERASAANGAAAPPPRPRAAGAMARWLGQRRGLAVVSVLTLLLAASALAYPARGELRALLATRQAPAAVPPRAAPCTAQTRRVTDYRGRAFNSVYHCRQLVGSNLYANPADLGPLEDVSFMTAADDVWVVCQIRGRPDPVVTHRTSSWWLYAQGDTVSRGNHYGYYAAWAFLPATVLAQGEEDRAVPGVPLCQLDLAAPGTPQVTSSDYPADGDWHGQAGQPGRFTFTPVTGTTDLAGFVYGFDTGTPDTFVASTGATQVRLSPPGPGAHTLEVRARDHSGNVSPYRAFAFEVGPRPADPAQALAAVPPGCPSGALCVYSGRNYTGSLSILHDCNRSWATFQRDDMDESWFNNGPTGRNARIWQNEDFTGLSYALAPGTGVTDGLDGSAVVVDQASSNDWPTSPGNPPPPPSDCPD